MDKLIIQIIFLIVFLPHQVYAFDDVYKIGMTTALSGPLSAIGTNMHNGIQAYFHKINEAGGINGKKLVLVARDDGYEPNLAAVNMRQLIDQDNVIAVIGNVGTPTAVVTVPIAIEKKTLLFGAFTGADFLRKFPPDRYIINYRASYKEEAAEMVRCILELGIKPDEIAFFTQRDGYGDAGFHGAESALLEHGFKNIANLAHGRYTRNTLNVEGALARILDAPIQPKAVIMAGSYEPTAKFIKLARQEIPDLLFFNLSFVGSNALLNALGDDAEDIIVTQVVPNYKSELPVAIEYLVDLKNYNNDIVPSFVSFEGYIVAKIFVEALKNIQGKFGKEKLIDSFHALNNLDIGLDENISYSSLSNQAIHRVWPMVVKHGKYTLLDKNSFGN